MGRGLRAALGTLVALGLLGLMPVTVLAAQPLCGDTLTSDTTLTSDLDCSAYAGTALFMGANEIVLDLNGYTIWGPAGNDGASGVDTNDYNKTKITNGTVANYHYGVRVRDSNQTKVTWLKITGEGDGSDYGIYVSYGAGNKINHVTIDPVNVGIYAEYGANLRVLNSTIEAVDSAIYSTWMARSNIRDNILDADYGVYDESSYRNRYYRNTANGGSHGFYFDCDQEGKVTLVGNTANDNTGYGFYLSNCYDFYSSGAPGTGSLIKNNKANGNDTGFYAESSPNATWYNNRAKNNDANGFRIDYPAGSVFLYNRSHWNGQSGFYLSDTTGYNSAAKFSWNRANYNGTYGHFGGYGVPGKGNRATGNGTKDCVNVRCI